jgi:hypothetical protein
VVKRSSLPEPQWWCGSVDELLRPTKDATYRRTVTQLADLGASETHEKSVYHAFGSEMKPSEIVNRLTGLSFPVIGGGVSWSPVEGERTAAKRILAWLEDRRVLYQPTEMEIPEHCIQSVLEIRAFISAELGKLDRSDALAQNLKAMRAACRKFLDQLQEPGRLYLAGPIGNMGSYSAWIFCSALGELRGVFGIHIAQIAVRNDLDVEDDLAVILPAQDAEDGAKDPKGAR